MKLLTRRVSPLAALIILMIIAAPTVIGLARQPAYSIRHPMEIFELGTELLALVFPLLAGLVATARINAEVGHGLVALTRTRAVLPRYLLRRLLEAAIIAFAAFFTGIFIWFLVCFYLDPAISISNDSLNGYPTTGAALEAAATSSTLSQLIAIHPLAYGIGYSGWVGLWAALWAVCTGILLFIIPNRIAAYAIPIAYYEIENIVLSNLNLPEIRAGYSAFPSGLTQQSPEVVLVPFAVILAATAGLWWYLRSTRFQTTPLS